jgi:aspartyl-tRNA synthetase
MILPLAISKLTNPYPALWECGNLWEVKGWVNAKRSHGKFTFIDIRDNEGNILQAFLGKGFEELNREDVVSLVGKVVKRPEKMVNPNLPTGTVELFVEKLTILNKCKDLPLPIDGDGRDIAEDVRLRYRYLDLRRPRMQANIKTRAKIIRDLRASLESCDLTEIETPILTQSTKEGARDFVVPSRLQPGKFYALPQSPQQYKQLLMTAGFKGYYQIARCFRDEALRADRGFEFTQLDLEMSFVKQEEIFDVVEGALFNSMAGCREERCLLPREALGGRKWPYTMSMERDFGERFGKPREQANFKSQLFPIITYKEAMDKYGTDKPDIRTEKEKANGDLAFCWIVNFPMFKQAKEEIDKLDSKSGWTFMHNPFSRPIDEHVEWHKKGENIAEIQAYQYDLVCNGMEIGSGSIRSHSRELLTATYRVMGYSDAQINASVGHMLEAFDLGTPPHGGIALGIDRLAMLVCGETSMKEVIPFPMTGSGKTSVMDAPSEI